jgi:putative addiction module killer protein
MNEVDLEVSVGLQNCIRSDTDQAVLSLIRSSAFDAWLRQLRDDEAKIKIFTRLRNAERGHFGDVSPVGEGISEMRIHSGPGYRIYYTRSGSTVYLLLTGGDKSSQKRDIDQAKLIARQFKERQP